MTTATAALTHAVPNSWRLRYRIQGRRYAVTFHGSLSDARKKLRELIRSGDTGDHVAPDKITLAAWVERWLALLERQPDDKGPRKRGLVTQRSIEKYSQISAVTSRGRWGVGSYSRSRRLRSMNSTSPLEAQLSPRTVHHIHTVLGACFKAAVRKGFLTASPVARADAPSPGDSDHGMVLETGSSCAPSWRASVLGAVPHDRRRRLHRCPPQRDAGADAV